MGAKEKKPRVRKTRDLAKAITLRPSEVTAAYGISQPVLWRLLNHKDAAERLPSILIPGRCGRKGMRLIRRDDLQAYLDRHSASNAA